MSYYNLAMPRESAWEVLNELGKIGTIHCIDALDGAPNISRPFANIIKRCDELLVKISIFESEFAKFKKYPVKCENYEQLIQKFNKILTGRNQAGQTYFESIESSINQQYGWFQEQLSHFENLISSKNHLVEMRAVLIKTKNILGKKFYAGDDIEDYGNGGINMADLNDVQVNFGASFHHMIGVIDASESARFQRIVFRITKGNVWSDIIDIDKQLVQGEDEIIDPRQRTKQMKKQVFIVMYPGGELGSIKQRLIRCCDSFGAIRYNFPATQEQFSQKLKDIDQRLQDSKQLVKMTEEQINYFINKYIGFNDEMRICSQIEEIKLYVLKERSLYATMNKFKIQENYIQGTCWIPDSLALATQDKLLKLGSNNSAGPHLSKVYAHNKKPPTYFRTNEFTAVFQQIVDTYGIPRYQEINPGLFTIMTFPFLFGVMYGDIGHGFGVFAFGVYLMFNSDSIKKDSTSMLKPLVGPRYLIFFMGLFATFCGFIYNDFLSVKLNLFNTCYDGEATGEYYELKDSCTYPFGIDPVWGIAPNSLGINNSLKMKMSVIFGVLQMMFGIILKGLNAFFAGNKLDFFFEFIPQIVFMTVTFFYMDIMIIIKWFTNYSEDTSQAPSIITMLINMPLKVGDPGEHQLYEGQAGIQKFFLIVSLLCIPLMLIPKPILEYRKYKKTPIRYSSMVRGPSEDERVEKKQNLLGQQQMENQLNQSDMMKYNIELQQHSLKLDLEKELQHANEGSHEDLPLHNLTQEDEHEHQDEHSFGELFVHQIIETIEFVLGSISNTASYLRLWALSLAHSQLAEVFLDKMLLGSIEEGSLFGIMFGFYIFFLITFGVLMCMDVMECFLHALRLHWVEFQNKFYKADGFQFQPFYFVKEIQDQNNDISVQKQE
ncbi:hypothetical protein PPERSA_05814 [Pseudocohnilembus persalinus]|uniref:V-type proton ATPase subunit a n=1 Tax=Pseudocohnilembus persalinus TaxID=266149 RepID=A0A0V0QGA8_PSEPJ|nr:hypothetical protein PPERSA_05814 [Pseudocohnilembus persalinus]|eukprot:KRX01228.1 hypothetical protein PPERSA_05814 [Pseudocohnilembus persalinus]